VISISPKNEELRLYNRVLSLKIMNPGSTAVTLNASRGWLLFLIQRVMIDER
jgi:hypothetical protein